jgi:CrcB protein
MSRWAIACLVAVSGGVGAALRLEVDGAIARRWRGEVAVGTVVVNVVGSFFAGIVLGCVIAHGLNPKIRTVVVTGFCGGLTTWSSAMYETVRLISSRRVLLAIGVGAGGFAASIAAAAAGFVLVGA